MIAMPTDSDGSSCDISFSYVRLFTQLEPFGWTFSVYDLERHIWIIYNEPALADDQEQAEDAAEAWAFGAGLLMTDVTLNWRRVTQGRHCHSKRQSG
jgi:hypothetical protein